MLRRGRGVPAKPARLGVILARAAVPAFLAAAVLAALAPPAAAAAAAAPAPAAAGAVSSLRPGWALLLGFLLVLLNGFFVAAEFALERVRPTQLAAGTGQGSRRSRLARHMTQHLDAYLSATQLGITLASLGLGWIGEPAFSWLIEPVVVFFAGRNPPLVHSLGLTLSFLAITVLHIVLGELTPKWVALRHARPTALLAALPLYGFYRATYPAIWVLNRAARGLTRLLGVAPPQGGGGIRGEAELRLLLATSPDDEVSQEKRELLDNVFELSHRVARQIMLPRQDVVYLSTTRPLAENLRLVRRSGHTRFPLCEGDLDHVIGLVHIKDLFRRERTLETLEEVAREIAFVPETLELDRLLKRMRAERFHLAAVLDEYGGVSGVVTLEDVIEVIVGQIHDEFDEEKPELQRNPDGTYLVSGGMLVEELEDALGLELSDRDEDTIGGVAFSELGRNPVVGDRVELGPITLEVLEMQRNRVRSLRVSIHQPAAIETESG
ncbi:MAG: HlyC/CorC family transporter [Acidobacteria bacterium]|nr:HlyC/CorC family transporter [Acidobacteriota bacterium]